MQTAADTLEWDERTGMPLPGGQYRADQVSLLRAAAHRIRTDNTYGDALKQLKESAAKQDRHEEIGATIDGLHRDWDRDRKLPSELVERTDAELVLFFG